MSVFAMVSPKVFQDVAEGAQKAYGHMQRKVPKAFKGAAGGTQRVLADFQGGLKRTINGISVPKPLAQTAEDISDLSMLQLGKPSICSRCATLNLAACFEKEAAGGGAYKSWSSPLSRIALHAPWCTMCKLLLAMLCREQHDPMSSEDVQKHIQQDWLRGVPFHKWVSEGYIHQDEYWPFGRSEDRHEGPTQVVGPFGEYLSELAKRSSSLGLKLLISSAAGRRPQLRLDDLKQSPATMYRQGYKAGEGKASRYPISALVLVTVSTALAETPGLLWTDLVGNSNRPGAEQGVLSHFMLHAVKGGISITAKPNSLSYGHVLDSNWINTRMAKLWLRQCETFHGTECSEHGWALAMDKPSFLRVIDVDNMLIMVVKNPQACRYVALSYVWGRANMVKLQSHNARELAQPGGLQEYIRMLPRTIIDAMQVVRVAGERFPMG